MRSESADRRPEVEGPWVCGTCGGSPSSTELSSARLSWSSGVENGRFIRTCPACTRIHARDIEGKLDSAWW